MQVKPGAYVVTTDPLGVSPRGGKASARDKDSLAANVTLSSHEYPEGGVSWKSSGGVFFLHVMQGKR